MSRVLDVFLDAERVYPRHLDEFAEEAGLGAPQMRRRLVGLARRVLAELPSVSSGPVAELVAAQCVGVLDRFGVG